MNHIDALCTDTRLIWCEMVSCDPQAGELARGYLDHYARDGVSTERAGLELMAWLVLMREAIGSDSAGRA